jgi:hypothetical protein
MRAVRPSAPSPSESHTHTHTHTSAHGLAQAGMGKQGDKGNKSATQGRRGARQWAVLTSLQQATRFTCLQPLSPLPGRRKPNAHMHMQMRTCAQGPEALTQHLLHRDGGRLLHFGELFGAGDELGGLCEACMQAPLVQQVGLEVV